eukprot:gene20199-26944_t
MLRNSHRPKSHTHSCELNTGTHAAVLPSSCELNTGTHAAVLPSKMYATTGNPIPLLLPTALTKISHPLQQPSTLAPMPIGLLSTSDHCSHCQLLTALGCLQHLDVSMVGGWRTEQAAILDSAVWAGLSNALMHLAQDFMTGDLQELQRVDEGKTEKKRKNRAGRLPGFNCVGRPEQRARAFRSGIHDWGSSRSGYE